MSTVNENNGATPSDAYRTLDKVAKDNPELTEDVLGTFTGPVKVAADRVRQKLAEKNPSEETKTPKTSTPSKIGNVSFVQKGNDGR